MGTSLERVRRSLYQVFMYSHTLFVPLFFIFGMLHEEAGGFIAKCIVPAMLYAMDYIFRIFFQLNRCYLSEASALPKAGIVTLKFKVPGAKSSSFVGGKFVYLRVVSIAMLQWHPFTVDRHEEVDGGVLLTLKIKAIGDWSTELVQQVQAQTVKAGHEVWCEGPHGCLSLNPGDHSALVCMVGGIGVTPAACTVWDLLEKRIDCNFLNHVHLVWVVRELEVVLSEATMLAACRTGGFKATIFVSRVKEEALQAAIDQQPILDGLRRAGVKFKSGRPDFASILDSALVAGVAAELKEVLVDTPVSEQGDVDRPLRNHNKWVLSSTDSNASSVEEVNTPPAISGSNAAGGGEVAPGQIQIADPSEVRDS